MSDTESTAWRWLLALPRLDIPDSTPGRKYRELRDRQVKIELCPGNLHSNCGAPMVKLSILLPGLKKRVHGSGNSLYVACERAQHEAWNLGVKLQFLVVFDVQRERDPNATPKLHP